MDGTKLGQAIGGLDAAKVAGLLVIGSLGVLAALRKGFGGIRIHVGD